MIMVVSGLYLLLFLGYYIFKRVKKWYAYYLFLISGGLYLLSYLSYYSSTSGGQKMFVLFTASGTVCLLIGLITFLMAVIRMKRMKGWADSPLTEEGKAVATETGKRLEDVQFNRVYPVI